MMSTLHAVVNSIYHVLSFAPYVVGGGVLFYALLAVLAFFGLPFAVVVLSTISPLIKGFFELIVGFFKTVLIPGLIDILDDWRTIIMVLVLMGSAGYFVYQGNCPATKIVVRAPMQQGYVQRYITGPLKSFTTAKTPAKKQVQQKAQPSNSLVKPFWENGD